MEEDPTAGFRKLNFLLSNPPFPPETFGNLLLLHCKYGYHELAADILAENRYYFPRQFHVQISHILKNTCRWLT